MSRPVPKLDLVSGAMAPSSYRIHAMVDGLDQIAADMERKWGVGRLRLIVSDFLRAKFDEQKDGSTPRSKPEKSAMSLRKSRE
jgi:hypothetical protein